MLAVSASSLKSLQLLSGASLLGAAALISFLNGRSTPIASVSAAATNAVVSSALFVLIALQPLQALEILLLPSLVALPLFISSICASMGAKDAHLYSSTALGLLLVAELSITSVLYTGSGWLPLVCAVGLILLAISLYIKLAKSINLMPDHAKKNAKITLSLLLILITFHAVLILSSAYVEASFIAAAVAILGATFSSAFTVSLGSKRLHASTLKSVSTPAVTLRGLAGPEEVIVHKDVLRKKNLSTNPSMFLERRDVNRGRSLSMPDFINDLSDDSDSEESLYDDVDRDDLRAIIAAAEASLSRLDVDKSNGHPDHDQDVRKDLVMDKTREPDANHDAEHSAELSDSEAENSITASRSSNVPTNATKKLEKVVDVPGSDLVN